MSTHEIELDMLLSGATPGAAPASVVTEEDLDHLLAGAEEPKAAGKARYEEQRQETNGQLKREKVEREARIQLLEGQFARAQKAMWGLGIACGACLLVAAGAGFWTMTQRSRALNEAFKIIHYREKQALSANAIVLDEWDKRVEQLISKVATLANMDEGERTERIKTLNALRLQAQNLRGGFLKQLGENEKEQEVGGGFSYRDPYLKKEIALNEELGGKIDLDKLKEEIRKNASLDQTMKSMEDSMLNPVPLSEQVRQQAESERREGALASVDMTKGLASTNPSEGLAPKPQGQAAR